MTIPCASPKAQYLPYREEVDAAIRAVLDSGTYILGEQVASFEEEFSGYLGAGFAIGCASGTDALVLVLKAMDIGPGDEVIVPSFTATPTVAAVVLAGAVPVYVDIEDNYYTIDPARLEEACTARTKAVIAVHLYGQSAALDPLVEITAGKGLRLIEDCAQAAGAAWRGKRLGSIGDVGCFSFFPTKNLGAIGDGGAVVCNDAALAARVRALRQYGWNRDRVSLEPGLNSRLDEMQAAILRIKLRHLDADNAERRRQAAVYASSLSGMAARLPSERDGAEHVYHLYVAQFSDRNRLLEHLKNRGILAGIHYPVPVHTMRAYRADVSLPVTGKAAKSVLSLPLFPGMEEVDQKKVVDAVTGYLS
jgi:dTDP-4-amino-4,6-dideoxygalactose transaminase